MCSGRDDTGLTGMRTEREVVGGPLLTQGALDAHEADGETGSGVRLAHSLVLDRPHDAKPEIVTVCSAHVPQSRTGSAIPQTALTVA